MDETPGVLLCPVFVAASKQKCDKYTGKTKPNKNQKQKQKKTVIIKVAQIKLPGSPGCLPGCLPARLLVVEASCCICAGKPAVARCANVRPSHDNPPPYNRYTK